jgi:hypothetical protein
LKRCRLHRAQTGFQPELYRHTSPEASYIQDTQQSGNQQLVQFFQRLQQDASRQADQAKQLLSQILFSI